MAEATGQGAKVTGMQRALFRARMRWRYHGARRLAQAEWLAQRMPWPVWCRVCASDAETAVAEIARRSGRPLRFVQIGSNDGKANDPLSASVRSHRWTGVLVEPIPRLFERLKENYAGTPGLEFANLAISSEPGTITMFTVGTRPGDPDWAEQLASLDRSVVMKHAYALPDLEGRIVPVEVASVRLPDLIASHGLETVDLLHVDAEGLDYEIISQVDLNASWAPRYLIFETKHMGLDRFRETKARLKRAGYGFVDLWPDALAYRSAP
jgi:FkbM family methyltransferase